MIENVFGDSKFDRNLILHVKTKEQSKNYLICAKIFVENGWCLFPFKKHPNKEILAMVNISL